MEYEDDGSELSFHSTLLKQRKLPTRNEKRIVTKSLTNEQSSLNFEIPSTDAILRNCIDKIWIKYDADNSGYLDREETRAFILESIRGETDKDTKNVDDESDTEFLTEK